MYVYVALFIHILLLNIIYSINIFYYKFIIMIVYFSNLALIVIT